MGSVTTSDVTITELVAPKIEPDQDGYTDSSMSGDEADESLEPLPGQSSNDPPLIPKRKGGRKPIYATSEERKQRNRQAQAAFRERRTEYIKQLETTIQQHEETLQNLQQSHRTAADECLMLRYKNSLLERILLEKGIDVQAVLALKGSPHLRPIRGPAVTGQVSPMQKAILNRQQQVRHHRPALAPPLQTVNASSHLGGSLSFAGSPTVQPTPPSQHSSPATAKSPTFALHGGMSSPPSDYPAHPIQQQQQQRAPRALPPLTQHSFQAQSRSQIRTLSSPSTSQPFPPPPNRTLSHPVTQNAYCPTPFEKQFEKHYDQLEQEYDQVEILDEMDADDLDADSFIPNFRLPPTTTAATSHMGMQASPPMTTSTASDIGGGGSSGSIEAHSVAGTVIDLNDPMLDADPFGLTASMHFPNPYSYPPRR